MAFGSLEISIISNPPRFRVFCVSWRSSIDDEPELSSKLLKPRDSLDPTEDTPRVSMNFVGKVSIYRNKATGDVVVLPHVRHPINGAPTEHGPVVRLESLDSGEQLLRGVWKGFTKYREPYREQDEVRRSNAEHVEFN
jgi:hypothetical protein